MTKISKPRALLTALRAGPVPYSDWSLYHTSPNSMRVTVYNLREAGHVIEFHDGLYTLLLDAQPHCPTCYRPFTSQTNSTNT